MARISPQGVRDLNVVMEVLHENGAVNSPSMGERYNLGGRVALAKGTPGGWWGDWELNYKDQMTFEEYKKALDIDKNPSGLEKAEGGRINKKPGGIVEPGVTNYGKKTKFISGSGTSIQAVDDPENIKVVREILKNNVEKKGSYRVLTVDKGKIESLLKGKVSVKGHEDLLNLINNGMDELNYLDKVSYKQNKIISSLLTDYDLLTQFTGNEKANEALKEFTAGKDIDHKYEDINRIIKQYKNGELINLPDELLLENQPEYLKDDLKDWAPTSRPEKSFVREKQLQYLDKLNGRNISLNQAQALFRKKFSNANPKTFFQRTDQLYRLKMEGKIATGKNSFLSYGVEKGDRSQWLKDALAYRKAGNYNKLLIAADALEKTNPQLAERYRNVASEFFTPGSGTLAKLGGQAEHAWLRTRANGQLKISSLVSGNLNDFKYLNFDKPVEEMIKKFNTTTDLAEKKRLSEAISKRRDFMNDLTGGMVEEVKFTFKDRKGGFLDTVVEENFTKEIDKLSESEIAMLSEKGTQFEKTALEEGAKLGLTTDKGALIKKRTNIMYATGTKIIESLSHSEQLKIATAVGCKPRGRKAEGGRIGFAGGSVGMLTCIDAKWEKNPKGFFRATANIASKGLDKLWKYASPMFLPAVQIGLGRAEHFKDPTSPEMWWDIILASDAVKRWGLDKVTLSQLKNASWAKRADIVGKLILRGGSNKILEKMNWVAKRAVAPAELYQGYKGFKRELDLVKKYAKENNIPYKEAELAYLFSGSAAKWRLNRASLFKMLGFGTMGPKLMLQASNDTELQERGKKIYEFLKEYEDDPVDKEPVKKEVTEEVTKKIELPDMPKRSDYGIEENLQAENQPIGVNRYMQLIK